MDWVDQNAQKSAEDEMKNLNDVLGIVSQLPKATAVRILEYCLKYVTDPSARSITEKTTDQILYTLLGKIIKDPPQ